MTGEARKKSTGDSTIGILIQEAAGLNGWFTGGVDFIRNSLVSHKMWAGEIDSSVGKSACGIGITT